MMRLMAMLMFGVVVFGAAFGATWFLKQQQTGHESAEAADVHDEGAASHDDAHAVHSPDAGSHAGSSHSGHAIAPAEMPPSPTPTGMPVAVRPRPMSIEELLRLGMGLNEREESLVRQAERLQRQESQLKLALADIKGEQQQIESLRMQVQQQLEVADGYLARIQKARDDLAADRTREEARFKEFESSRLEINSQQRENIKQLSTWIQSMEPEKASAVLREMSNDGRIETAVKLLSQLEERDVAKILSALDDAKLVDQFITRFQDLKRPERTASRR